MSELDGLIQAEQQRLYEVSSLTDELIDDDAQILLSWASAQLPLMSVTLDTIEQQAKTLRRLVRSINRYVGQAQYTREDERQTKLERIYTYATELSYPVQSEQLPILLVQFHGINAHDVLTLLIAWLDGNTSSNSE
jgi:hypothetical protein